MNERELSFWWEIREVGGIRDVFPIFQDESIGRACGPFQGTLHIFYNNPDRAQWDWMTIQNEDCIAQYEKLSGKITPEERELNGRLERKRIIDNIGKILSENPNLENEDGLANLK